MLKTLTLKNLLLIEEATVSFEEGFTVITGETGAGKTAFIEALRLVLGQRADFSKVRRGEEKAWIQASFSLSSSPSLSQIFTEAGLFFPEDEDLILTREISSEGKSRAFASGQMVPASFLQSIAPHLIDFVGQHATVLLKNPQTQREFLDLYANLDLAPFQRFWEEEKSLKEAFTKIQNEHAEKVQKKQQLDEQYEELTSANLQEGEEETLFEEYTLLANAQALQALSGEALVAIEETSTQCLQIQISLQNIEKQGVSLGEAMGLAKETRLQLNELETMLQTFQARLESDPGRLLFLEERLALWERLKKKYGKDLFLTIKETQKRLESLECLEEKEKTLLVALEAAENKTAEEAYKIHQKREEAAKELESKLSILLKELNFQTAEMTIQVEPITRTKTGEDAVTFFLRANKGEQKTAIQDSSSGGELSRLLFALKVVIAEKGNPSTMVFDEIDANVGGETATRMGQYLHYLGEKAQVLCITHFPQVARQGDHHLCVAKVERLERTEGKITKLLEKEREEELVRMLGGMADTPHLTLFTSP